MKRLRWMKIRRRLIIGALRQWRRYRFYSGVRQFAIASAPIIIALAFVALHYRRFIHPPKTELDTWIDVLLGTLLLAIVPFAMAAYGGHIAAEGIQDSKRQKNIKLRFWGACVIGVLLAFVQQYRSVRQDAATKLKTSQVEGAILGQLQSLHDQGKVLSPEQVEVKRREDILSMLRGQYILQHQNLSAGIIEGREPLPSDWVNARLNDLKEIWSVTNIPSATSNQRSSNSYISWSGSPAFGRTKIGGDAHLQVGDLYGFNIDYKNGGPDAVVVTSQCQSLFVEPDDNAETEKRVTDEFKQFCAAWWKVQPQAKRTMAPGQALFVTAFAPEQSSSPLSSPRPIRRVNQEDLNKLRSAQEFAFALAEINYVDNGRVRQLRMCAWLQPPADPPGIWHYCGIFN
jgi:hypothetical protein